MFTFKIFNGDIPFNSATGRPLVVSGNEKFNQDVEENLGTVVQSNGTGAGLEGVIGLIGDAFSLRAEISRRVKESFDYLKRIHDSVQRYNRAPEEVFNRVVQVVVTPLKTQGTQRLDPTRYAFRVDVVSNRGKVSTSGSISGS